jgi:hypothetical protein
VFLLGSLLVLPYASPAGAVFVDAVVAQVGSAVVSASDIALARALGLFGFTPSAQPIDAGDVDRYAAALGDVLEASRLGLGPSPAEMNDAWRALEERQGGATAFRAWLDTADIDPAWARRALEAHLRWRAWAEFHEAFADKLTAPGPAKESTPTKPPIATEVIVHRLLGPSKTVAVPFAMPR